MPEPILTVLKTEKVEIREGIVNFAEKMAERARAGEFTGMVMVATCKEGGFIVESACWESALKLVGALAMAQEQVIRESRPHSSS